MWLQGLPTRIFADTIYSTKYSRDQAFAVFMIYLLSVNVVTKIVYTAIQSYNRWWLEL